MKEQLLRRGNGKLGEGIHTWSLPAVETCPGRSELCERVCYARNGFLAFPSNVARMQANLDVALSPAFVPRMVAELTARCVTLCRWHVSGDFFSAEYANRCNAIFRRKANVRFWLYTRSWRVESMRPALRRMARLPNVRLWLSADRETGAPPVMEGARVAWLETADGEGRMESDLVFRTRALRNVLPRLTPLSLVCPVERPNTDTDCHQCGRCWRS